jgi:hypothetical protein
MSKTSLIDLYLKHEGKFTDRWSSYLDEYERVFFSCNKDNINILEIGIQNGGSLEIWGDYFPNASNIIGCDINDLCRKLVFNDPRVKVIVGDVTDDNILIEIMSASKSYSLIIDDASHTSLDIIKTFLMYFPLLEDDGVFIIEDLHCSYWEAFGGGLYYPFSSISFFKNIIDIINFQHWGSNKTKEDFMNGFAEHYDLIIEDKVLNAIHSVEFINSLCIIRKSSAEFNKLGKRMIKGRIDLAAPSCVSLDNSPYKFNSENFNQLNNKWTNRQRSPAEDVLDLEESLKKAIQDLNIEKERLLNIQSSLSWKVTAPFRQTKKRILSLLSFILPKVL